MQAIIFAIISYIGWGTGDIFGTVATRKIGPYSATLWYLIFQIVLSVPLAIFFLDDLKNITPTLFMFNVILGIFGTAGLVTFYEALKVGSASLVGTISASFVVVVVFLSILFLGESLTMLQFLAVAVIFIGILISSLDPKDLKSKRLLQNRGVSFAVLTMLFWGIYWTFIKIPVQALSWYWPSMISLLGVIFLWLFMNIRKIKVISFNAQNAGKPILANAFLLGIGAFSFNFAIERGYTAIVAPIAGSYPTLFALLAYFFFKDPIEKREIAGIVITLSGIVLLSFTSI